MHRFLTDLRRFDQGGGWATQGYLSCAHWMSWRLGWTLGAARAHVRVANKLAEVPAIDAAARNGELTFSKLRAIARVATPANEAALLEEAKCSTGAQLEKICRKYRTVLDQEAQPSEREERFQRYLTRRDAQGGMVRIEANLRPEEAAVVWAALDRLAAEACAGAAGSAEPPVAFDRADALVAMAQSVLRGTRPERSPMDVMVTIPLSTLHAPVTTDPAQVASFTDGTCVAAETARRLCCDAGLVVVVEDPVGSPLSVGRKLRTISGALKRALLRRDVCCKFPGCTNRLYLEGHHVKHWAMGGETSLANALLLCSRHHKFVHEFGYGIQQHPDGTRFVDPKGRVVAAVPAPARPDDPAALGWPTVLEENRALGITAETIDTRFMAEPVDYEACVELLLRNVSDPAA